MKLWDKVRFIDSHDEGVIVARNEDGTFTVSLGDGNYIRAYEYSLELVC